jgi:membrane-associated phospholipid phosphatase
LRPVAWSTAATVGAARVYVGAHLPLDVVGGAALGVAAGSAARGVGRRLTARRSAA